MGVNAFAVSLLLLPALLLPRPDADLTNTWNAVDSTIRGHYYARDTRKEEMESLLAAYGPRARSAPGREEFKGVVNQMIARFKDSHFELFTKADQGFYMMDCVVNPNPEKMPWFGAWFKRGPMGYIVSMVLDGSSAAQAGLRKGDVVDSVDGMPFTPVASLGGLAGHDVTLQLRRGAAALSARVSVAEQTGSGAFLAASEASVHVISRNGRQIGYVRLWTLLNDSFRHVLSDSVYGKLKDTDGIILDLRDGFGGSPDGFADPFFRPDVLLEWRSAGTVVKSPFGYGRPLVVLINGGSRSAKELLSFILRKYKRAVLVGQRTAGNVLATTPTRVADWGYLELPVMDVHADGVRLEAAGVQPDVAVPQEFDKDGNDLILEAGLKEIDKMQPTVRHAA